MLKNFLHSKSLTTLIYKNENAVQWCCQCSQIPDEHFSIPDPGSKQFLNPGSASASKNLSILTQKIVFKLSEIWSRMFTLDPDSGFRSWFFTHPGARGQKGTGSRIRNTAVLYCFSDWADQSITVCLRADPPRHPYTLLTPPDLHKQQGCICQIHIFGTGWGHRYGKMLRNLSEDEFLKRRDISVLYVLGFPLAFRGTCTYSWRQKTAGALEGPKQLVAQLVACTLVANCSCRHPVSLLK